MSYYDMIWTKYNIKLKEEESPTAEGLRAAAKILEEKAKELDKPKLTDAQQRTLAAAKELGMNVYRFDGIKYYNVYTDGEVYNSGYDYKSLHYFTHQTEVGLVSIRVFKDEYDDYKVGIPYPNY